MGCFGWANICELVGKFILNVDRLIQIYIRIIILNQSRVFSKVKVEKEKKTFIRILKECTKVMEHNDLDNNEHETVCQDIDTLTYISKYSIRPPSILRQLQLFYEL